MFPLIGKNGGKFLPRAVESALHRADGYARNLRNILVALLFQRVEDDDGAHVGGKLVDGAGNIAGGFAVEQRGFGGRGIIRRFKAVFRNLLF